MYVSLLETIISILVALLVLLLTVIWEYKNITRMQKEMIKLSDETRESLTKFPIKVTSNNSKVTVGYAITQNCQKLIQSTIDNKLTTM